MAWCPECGEACDREDICRTCHMCEECCDCDDVTSAETFDADEFGEEPEDEYERRTR
jgi:hypothetical protein